MSVAGMCRVPCLVSWVRHQSMSGFKVDVGTVTEWFSEMKRL